PILLIDGDTVQVPEAFEKARAIVRVEVMATDCRNRAPTVHVSAGYRASTAGMAVIDYRQLESGLRASRRVVAARALHHVPAVVDASAIGCDDIHLFVQILSDVGDVKKTCRLVEGIAPRIPQSFRPDLAATVGLTNIRIVGG